MSALIPLQTLRFIESHIDPPRIVAYNHKTWTVCLYATGLYLALVFAGRRWMQDRKPFKLRKPLVLWNLGLAVFSIFGAASILPLVFRSLYDYGVDYTVCHSDATAVPRIGLWCFYFAISKLVELGDTAFIVLRKTPLSFLHWYHHVTVLICAMYGLNTPNAAGTIFGGMNYFVHSIMYSYFACRALGVAVPRQVAQAITILQLSQMFVGVFITARAFYNDRSGHVPGCVVRDDLIIMEIVMYGTYAILFLHFFCVRYCSGSGGKTKSKKL